MRVSPHGIGGESFCEWVGGMYRKRVEASRQLEDASFRDARKTLDIATILSVLTKVFETPEELFRRRQRNSVLRGMAARFLCKYAGLTQREVADVLEMGSGAAVSHQMRKLAGLLESDRRLKCQVTETGRLLDRQSLGSVRPDR